MGQRRKSKGKILVSLPIEMVDLVRRMSETEGRSQSEVIHRSLRKTYRRKVTVVPEITTTS